jgi:hypothetical protein
MGTYNCSQTVTFVSCHRLAGLRDIARLKKTVKDASESFLGSFRLVKRSKAAWWGVLHEQRQYLEIVENRLSKSGASRGFDLDVICVSSGGGCLVSSLITLDSSCNELRSWSHSAAVLGLTSFMRTSSESAVTSFFNFRSVSNRGNCECLKF